MRYLFIPELQVSLVDIERAILGQPWRAVAFHEAGQERALTIINLNGERRFLSAVRIANGWSILASPEVFQLLPELGKIQKAPPATAPEPEPEPEPSPKPVPVTAQKRVANS